MTMTTRKRHSPEQVVPKLVSADRMLGEGKGVADVCCELQISEQTYYRWRNQLGGLKADDARRHKDLERENGIGVEDADAHCAYAKEQGADLLKPPVDQHYGVREYGGRDLEGHLWYFHSPLD
jgi:putative transposase